MKKRGMEISFIGWLIIALAVLVLVGMGYIILSGKGTGFIEQIKNLLRFRN